MKIEFHSHSCVSMMPLLFCLLSLFVSGISHAADKPLQVFILSGQSNMQGHAHVRTLKHLGMDPKTKPLLDQIQNADGTPKVHKDISISYLSSGDVKRGQLTTGFGASDEKIGPELTFGITMQQQLGEPILIIKTAWGGKSLNTDFRPPSAGPYQFDENQLANWRKQGKDLTEIKAAKEEATGHYYRLMIDHVNAVLADLKKVSPDYDPKRGYELAGFVWFQGWNDMVDGGTYPNRYQPGGYEEYSKVLAHFIRDVRKDLKAPELPFVIGVMGAGGPVEKYHANQKRYAGVHSYFRDAMAAPAEMPEFKENVVAVRTENYWDNELSDLRYRESQIRQQVKKQQQEENLTRDQARELTAQLYQKSFTDRERKILEVGVSNAEYHYLGSSKILGQIGKAFAEALSKMD